MFSDYRRLVQAIEKGSLKEELKSLVAQRVSTSWNGHALTGHVPLDALHAAQATLATEFAQKGLYMWGGWKGDEARILYVGIAHDYTLADRIAGRYFLPNAVGPDFRFSELSFAKGYANELKALPGDWSPNRPVDIDKYRRAGIPVPPQKGRYRRLWRAERYAKTGLENVWFYPIPSPADVTKRGLEATEKQLIKASAAMLHDWKVQGRGNATPLLNVVHVRGASGNPHVSHGDAESYRAWLDAN